MNYRHAYHAGNFADVIKHIVLINLISAMHKKDKSFCYIDTHAGAGCYDLFADSPNKTKEYEGGIEKIIRADHPPALIKQYLDCIHGINNKLTGSKYASLRYYPGSPLIARAFARAHDRLIACELQPQEYEKLRTTFLGDKQVAVHHTDGFLGLKAFLPPPERRGLILIDPPYENPDEFTRIAQSLPAALKRFETGVYAIWYPIKEHNQVERFYRSLESRIEKPITVIELTIYPDLPHHLNGCGMAVINPPFQFTETTKEILPWVWQALAVNGAGMHKVLNLR
jgi:23S rRNA (adenine2030-N6)-methyltransferase